jgi:hypothetical protein
LTGSRERAEALYAEALLGKSSPDYQAKNQEISRDCQGGKALIQKVWTNCWKKGTLSKPTPWPVWKKLITPMRGKSTHVRFPRTMFPVSTWMRTRLSETLSTIR